MGILSGREFFMHSSRSPRGGTPGHAVGGRSLDSAALPALLRASHLLALALPSAPRRPSSAPEAMVRAEGLVCAPQRPPQFSLRPYNDPQFPLRPPTGAHFAIEGSRSN